MRLRRGPLGPRSLRVGIPDSLHARSSFPLMAPSAPGRSGPARYESGYPTRFTLAHRFRSWRLRRRAARAPLATSRDTRLALRSLRRGLDFLEALLEGVPRQGCALDAHRELHDALESFEVAEPYAFELGREIRAVALSLELRLVDRHQRLERADELADLGDGLPLHGRTHHRGRRLADRTALATDLDVGDEIGGRVDDEEQHDLVAAQRIETFDLVCGRHLEFAAVSR